MVGGGQNVELSQNAGEHTDYQHVCYCVADDEIRNDEGKRGNKGGKIKQIISLQKAFTQNVKSFHL